MEDAFLKELHHEISNSRARLKSLKFWGNFLKISAIILTFIITVILGWNFIASKSTIEPHINNIVLILGALATLVTTFTKSWNTEKKFVSEEFLGIRLSAIRTKYLIFKDKPNTEDKIASLIEDFSLILENRAPKNQNL